MGQRQAAKAWIGFTALDNSFATVADPAAVQAIYDRLGPEQITAPLDNPADGYSRTTHTSAGPFALLCSRTGRYRWYTANQCGPS